MKPKLTVAQAAKKTGLSTKSIWHHIVKTKRLPATKFGRQWQIDEKDLAKIRHLKAGRPPTVK